MDLDVVALTPSRRAEAASVLAEAFLDDPVWVAIGPAREAARRRLLRRFQRIAVGEALRWGGPNWCAVRDGAVVGVALTFASERFPPPRATPREAPPFLLAGPGPAWRAARIDAVVKRAHPHEPHLLLWYLGTHPDAQRQGVGRALVHHVLDAAEGRGTPVYLDTTKPENVVYYRQFGFREVSQAGLPRGARFWGMRREVGEGR